MARLSIEETPRPLRIGSAFIVQNESCVACRQGETGDSRTLVPCFLLKDEINSLLEPCPLIRAIYQRACLCQENLCTGRGMFFCVSVCYTHSVESVMVLSYGRKLLPTASTAASNCIFTTLHERAVRSCGNPPSENRLSVIQKEHHMMSSLRDTIAIYSNVQLTDMVEVQPVGIRFNSAPLPSADGGSRTRAAIGRLVP
jgi:hypothetical protein